MSIQPHPGKKPLVPPPPPTWGEVAPEGETARVVRFVLADRVVSFPVSEFRRWELVAGEPETFTLFTGKESVVVEGRELVAIQAALDLQRLCEIRTNHQRSNPRPGPRVLRIAIETA